MNPPDAALRVMGELDVVVHRDPSVHSRAEAVLHPSVVAVSGHRIAHRLHRRGRRVPAKVVAAIARLLSGGIDIHPAARIGRRFLVDHGCGVVVGETAVIGDDVTVFHQVTLGADERRVGRRRHPELGRGVTVGANATLIGPITIGDAALIGANSLVCEDVPPGSRVHAPTGHVAPFDRAARSDVQGRVS